MRSECDGETLRIAIHDTGIGMSGKELERLFKPFQQVDGSITRRFGGTGLGLALSQRLVMAMNGRITVESEKGRGTTFTVELPVLAPDQAERRPIRAERGPIEAERGPIEAEPGR